MSDSISHSFAISEKVLAHEIGGAESVRRVVGLAALECLADCYWQPRGIQLLAIDQERQIHEVFDAVFSLPARGRM